VFFDKNLELDENKRYVGIGHSIGFQKLNNSGIQFDYLVGLQGFVDFCGSGADQRRSRVRNIDGMIKMFQNDPVQSLQGFYKVCQYDRPTPKNISAEELIADLESMKKSYEHCGCPTLIIGSDADEIVPMSIINDNFQNLGSRARIEEINGVPHSLGFLKAKEVAEKIENLKEFGSSQ
jgi:pimeloyl-[acyl-carrier protein] methyl ester esterase